MLDVYFQKTRLNEVVEQLTRLLRVYAPVLKGAYHEFTEIKSSEEADLGFQNTRLSPKGLFHPHLERMFEFTLTKGDPGAGILKEVAKDYSPSAILGIRPCDARAFQLDDVNFDTAAFKDPWWVERRRSTALIGLACNEPCATCFCTTVGTGPFDTTGLDAMLVDVGEGYVLRAVTQRGEALVSKLGLKDSVPAEEASKVEALNKSAEQSLGKLFDAGAIADKSTAELFNAAFWDEVQFSCINCGTCTFLCPTCWCFDIQDEVQGEKGERLRLWDSCMFPLFTHHGSGHNPRHQKLQRVRQRFMHKLKYYQDKYHQGVACVGCGRCVTQCPVNIDIRGVAQLMSASCIC